MEAINSLFDGIRTDLLDHGARALAALPAFAGALAIILLGWIFARIVRGSTHHLASYVDRLLDRVLRRGALASARIPAAAFAVLGEIAFWLVLVVAVAIAARVAGLVLISTWLDRAVTHLPNLFLGAVLVVFGYFASARIGAWIELRPDTEHGRRGALLGRLGQVAIIATVAIVGLDQVGMDITMLVVVLGVSIGAGSIGIAVAFGLGARRYVDALIAARVARRTLAPGMTVRIGEAMGEVLEITATHIVLDTDEGKLLVPAGSAMAADMLVTSREHDGGGSDEAS